MVSNSQVGLLFTSNSRDFEGTYDFQHSEILTFGVKIQE